ncbi:hypothetical protein DDZ18_06820 [Marinicauda salina]|uniref:Sulfotransferase family protein n=1 Tax=Marinicauda salina TaxID=2135793 RepID=A0A2U2BTQ8_9PROT|nr:hypothetical protein [Marinicauda salina]PWE17391.1 hypothetical protein DDZ18_06820 [Marinicauda salina]
MTDPAALLADSAWHLDALDLQAGRARFVKLARGQLEDTPFLDERLDRTSLESADIALGELASGSIPAPDRAPVFIWHSAFCGSTLLARCLSAEGASVCLREPAALMALASLKRHGHTARFQQLAAPTFRTLGRTAGAGERAVIKPTNIVNNLVGEAAQAFPDAKHLFLTSDIEAFIVSIAKKAEPGRAFARRMFALFARDGLSAGRIPGEQLFGLTDMQVAALVWHMEIEQMRAAQAALGTGRAAWLDGDAFIARPAEALAAADAFFDIGLGEDRIAEVVSGPLMARDAKDPGRAFGAETRRSEGAAVREQLGDDLGRIVEWSFQVLPSTPRSAYLANALI